jgi:hypothetical protein
VTRENVRSERVSGPQQWCSPPMAFGQLTLPNGKPVKHRRWLPPPNTDFVGLAKFRASVMQNAICVHVRQAKNLRQYGDDGNATLTQKQLAALDPRPDTQKRWNARLCGRANLTTADIATLMVILPGALPNERTIKTFLDVAEKKIARPAGWPLPDS